ncbi:uncharacterized protein PITG_04901 [Phytophthora infestans T30-4]|uniref:Uncharacterized protein n=1 Tax=Phytophthora infestans (strain T30-4) TaxID=403677 RepID=D0N2B5_PHYIT|nr:uncharacterized protein PITG_04901 [Phytophthora infestans T30-4]EEY68444.1 hypothetical protein PITG_04901 [Phytophthora infestans T30-4]|eukprot:XP_002905603.1 hypothetical protein PITG_04901 [Phytophthora infestans T30-4]
MGMFRVPEALVHVDDDGFLGLRLCSAKAAIEIFRDVVIILLREEAIGIGFGNRTTNANAEATEIWRRIAQQQLGMEIDDSVRETKNPNVAVSAISK